MAGVAHRRLGGRSVEARVRGGGGVRVKWGGLSDVSFLLTGYVGLRGPWLAIGQRGLVAGVMGILLFGSACAANGRG